ncbi:unnamed protein product [Mycena citricolor]|uniref:Uncharacterized protein n=1 Tax=Mycena citricolor TaxID=2018698 RepID=A0AAD2HTI6_9AGAR|nr:unnamed protein product [Mycena citricolor]
MSGVYSNGCGRISLICQGGKPCNSKGGWFDGEGFKWYTIRKSGAVTDPGPAISSDQRGQRTSGASYLPRQMLAPQLLHLTVAPSFSVGEQGTQLLLQAQVSSIAAMRCTESAVEPSSLNHASGHQSDCAVFLHLREACRSRRPDFDKRRWRGLPGIRIVTAHTFPSFCGDNGRDSECSEGGGVKGY